jgi:hypothetical protein
MRPPGIEPGSKRWQRSIITIRPRAHSDSYQHRITLRSERDWTMGITFENAFRFPGKQTSSEVFAEDPALRLLSGSTPSTRHGVRNNFKNSLFGGGVRTPTRRTSRLLGAATPRPRFPGKQTSSCPRVFARGFRASFAVGVHPFHSARRPQ